MYLQIRSTSDFETENAEADCCHLNGIEVSLFSLIKSAELSAMMEASSSSDKSGDFEINKCT